MKELKPRMSWLKSYFAPIVMTGVVPSLLFLADFSAATADASIVQVEVIYGQSNLNLAVNGDVSQPGTIKGRIVTDSPTTAQVYVNSTDVIFTNGSSSFRAYLTGTIGGRPVSAAPVFLSVTPESPLLVDLRFDISPGQLSSGAVPAGFYPSTPVLIYALSN